MILDGVMPFTRGYPIAYSHARNHLCAYMHLKHTLSATHSLSFHAKRSVYFTLSPPHPLFYLYCVI